MTKNHTLMAKTNTLVKWVKLNEINQGDLFNFNSIMVIKLSKRELEVIKKIADGYRTLDIAEMLCISPYTVKTHRRNVMFKMEAGNFASVVSVCIKNGWI